MRRRAWGISRRRCRVETILDTCANTRRHRAPPFTPRADPRRPRRLRRSAQTPASTHPRRPPSSAVHGTTSGGTERTSVVKQDPMSNAWNIHDPHIAGVACTRVVAIP